MRRALLLLPLLTIGCAPPSGSGLGVRLLPGPALHVQPSAQFVIELSAASQRPDVADIDATDVRAQADMRHAGMGSAVARVTPLGRGRYRLSGVALPMAGDWVLSVQASDHGRPVSGTVPFSVLP